MTHKERLMMALNHEEPDRVPICAWYTPEAESRVRRHRAADFGEAARKLPMDVLMDHDLVLCWLGPCTGYYMRPDREYNDEWGIGWKWFENQTGAYTEMVRRPLAGIRDPAEFTMPDFSRPDRYQQLHGLIDEYGEEFPIMGGLACTLFELSWYLRGMEQVMMDLVENRDFFHAYLDKLMEWIRVAGERFVEAGADIIFIGDDVGAQNRMLISPATFREFLKPRYATLFADWKRRNPAVKIAYHSDGYIYPIIADMVEIGLDILNPVQPASMDPAVLKRDFGHRLTFWGTVDIQHVLPFGTPADVAAEVRLRCETAGKGGGLILSPAHNIQAEVPLDNILAFYSAAREYGSYRS